ncbi:hypothetical protein [Burkholderia ubonensis]|uniref:hypothetical protein n=1 Tax=Burkholderia ubonensis TaxID=101571 RepID=UPI002AB0F13B|nr:hypothetical protein [Burkholderia ubonensis]
MRTVFLRWASDCWNKLRHVRDASSSDPQRLSQAHFDMLRALKYHGGEWDSVDYCAWRIGRTGWIDGALRGPHIERTQAVARERYPMKFERAAWGGRAEVERLDAEERRRAADMRKYWGPDRMTCVLLCEQLMARGLVRVKVGHRRVFEVTERGLDLIRNATAN